MITYQLWTAENKLLETFAGPCRLAQWDSVPPGWHIEEFDGDTSRGGCTLDDVKRHALDVVLTPENSGSSATACDIARNLFALDGFDRLREPGFAASCARLIDSVLSDYGNQTPTVARLDRGQTQRAA